MLGVGARPATPDPLARIDWEQTRPLLPGLIDALSEAVLIVDGQRRIVAANRRYLEVFGLHTQVQAGAACQEALRCPEVRGEGTGGTCLACDVLKHGRVARRIHDLPDATGALRRWEGTFNPVANDDGVVTHVVEVWRDVSDRAGLEFQLAHSERLAALGILAAGVGHEINNPLASMLAGAESLSRWLERTEFGAAMRDEAAETIGMIEREIERVRTITDKLMLLARPEAALQTWVKLHGTALDTLSLLGFEMRQRRITLRNELDAALPAVWADENAMRSVWMNLLMNAVQAMTAGGTLTVGSGRTDLGVRFWIEDTGPGIPPALFDRIWDPFFTTKPPGKGTGLGLSITQRAVARHDGQIRVENVKGGGARFTVEVPTGGPGGSNG